MTAEPAPLEPDFASLEPFEISDRYELLSDLGALWNRWDAHDERWLVVRQLIWAISAQDTDVDARFGRALLATVAAVENAQRREEPRNPVDDEMLDAIKTGAGTLSGLADEVRLARDHVLALADPTAGIRR